eukprot:CAMPEP_0172485350 /NCGR_PEP_ID=MMETSP1066-20121228/13397_1 /TAXON_ID=671091 /ORGANISM="Coscinodiscus wailesii, Strain CCMP2513" /LENGTH=86 /DNA_ID=CAMNT_0013250575 /DNA_START=17 /DNA_END=274 /DNA_ORIENTATION=-
MPTEADGINNNSMPTEADGINKNSMPTEADETNDNVLTRATVTTQDIKMNHGVLMKANAAAPKVNKAADTMTPYASVILKSDRDLN